MSDKKEEEEVWNTISRKNYLHPPEISIFLCAGWTSLKNFDSHDPFQRNSSARKPVINVVCPKVYPSPIQIPSLAITFDFNYRFGMDKRILTTILDDGLFPPCSAAQFAPPLRWLEGVQKGTTCRIFFFCIFDVVTGCSLVVFLHLFPFFKRGENALRGAIVCNNDSWHTT